MELYLGASAREFLPSIRLAVKAWNDLVPGLIDLKEDSATYAYLGNPIIGIDKYHDGVSVIYVPNVDDIAGGGFAIARQGPSADSEQTYEITESDVFVWPQSKEGMHSSAMHEIGHAIGLRHITISGNIMSYSSLRAMAEPTLRPFLEIGAFPDYYRAQPAFLSYLLHGDPRYRSLVARIVRPGVQDRAMLSCLYDSWRAAAGN